MYTVLVNPCQLPTYVYRPIVDFVVATYLVGLQPNDEMVLGDLPPAYADWNRLY